MYTGAANEGDGDGEEALSDVENNDAAKTEATDKKGKEGKGKKSNEDQGRASYK